MPDNKNQKMEKMTQQLLRLIKEYEAIMKLKKDLKKDIRDMLVKEKF